MRERLLVGQPLEGTGGDHIGPAVDAGLRLAAEIEATADPPNPSARIHTDRTERAPPWIVAQKECHRLRALTMQVDEPGEVAVEKHVASEDQARVALAQEGGGPADAASSAEQARLVGKGDRKSTRLNSSH